MIADLQSFIAAADTFVWNKILIYVLVPLGVIFTVFSGFVQFRYFGRMFGVLAQAFSRRSDKPTSFQALALSVAGRVGTGNIAGVAIAISLGGPGAIFWMWVVGLFGMATSFFECSIAQLYKRTEADGSYRGGPAFYAEHGLKKILGPGSKVLAILLSILLFITFGIAFVVVQSYSISASFEAAFDVKPLYTGLGLAALVGLIIFGGVKRIASAAEIVVPLMALAYIAMAVWVLFLHYDLLPTVLTQIVTTAFAPGPAVAGGIGAVITLGVKRGLFSNEAGLGSAPNVAAVAYVQHPVQQGIVQALSVFIDTILICTCTAFMILLSGIDITAPGMDGITITQSALASHVGDWAEYFVSIALLFFVFTSIMYNYYLGENAIDYFSGANRHIFNIFRVMTLGVIVYGSLNDLNSAFAFSNLTMGIMAVVNLAALVLLFPVGLRLLKDYEGELKAGRRPVFDKEKFADLDIDPKSWDLVPDDEALLAERRKAEG